MIFLSNIKQLNVSNVEAFPYIFSIDFLKVTIFLKYSLRAKTLTVYH